jgi:hypothetical protein
VLNDGFSDSAVIKGVVGVIRFARFAHVRPYSQTDDYILFILAFVRAEANHTAQTQIVNLDHVHCENPDCEQTSYIVRIRHRSTSENGNCVLCFSQSTANMNAKLDELKAQ